MCGEVVDCRRAVEWGVAQYAPDGDVMQFTLDMAAKWAQKPELASHLAKKVIDFGLNSDKALLVERIAEAVLYQVTRRRPPCFSLSVPRPTHALASTRPARACVELERSHIEYTVVRL